MLHGICCWGPGDYYYAKPIEHEVHTYRYLSLWVINVDEVISITVGVCRSYSFLLVVVLYSGGNDDHHHDNVDDDPMASGMWRWASTGHSMRLQLFSL